MVFRTGTNQPILTLNIPFTPAASNSILRFDFGFSTDEPDVVDTFFDSFSATVQGTNAASSALLFTADRTGVQWTPSNPGGTPVDPAGLVATNGTFADLNPNLALKVAYSVSWVLTANFMGIPLTLLFDLFDNLNAASSLAYVGNARIESAVPAFRLQSAANVQGPYVDEPLAALDSGNRAFTLGLPSGDRFFRVVSDKDAVITGFRIVNQQLVINFDLVQVALHSSGTVGGPYTAENSAVLDESGRNFHLTKPAGNRFFRIASNARVRISRLRVQATDLVIDYAFRP